MDSQNGVDACRSSSWTSAANWTIVGGSIEKTVTYESFYSSIDVDDTADSSTKSPLVLRLPSPESGPCEITVCFEEMHEIRQVYVRSTARVYEMYYATNSPSGNEYLCTVRCGAASRDEDVLHTTDIGMSANMKEPNEDTAEGSLKSGGYLNANEDDWVEVKGPDARARDHEDSSSPSMFSADSMGARQNFYEATAEITDASPCTSITIRLLSLQNKSLVYVDEVYVFANPVNSEEEGLVVNSTQSSFMSMLVPTLLQLSKTKTTGSSRNDDERTSDAEGMNRLPKIGSKAFDSTSNLSGNQQEEKLPETDCDEGKLRETNESDRAIDQSEVHLQVPVKERKHDEGKLQETNASDRAIDQSQAHRQVPVKEMKHDEPLQRIESMLDHLVSRMGRIENYFLRFEENILKPINGIEGRLKQVEQQLEVLTKESHGPEPPSCYRMSAPNFSGNESGSNSFHNSVNDHTSCGPIELDRNELYSGASSIALEDTSYIVTSSLLRPSLVVTAPEFSNGEDDEEAQALEVAMDSLKSKPKPSIDEVLASALAQFSSSFSIKTPEYTEAVVVSVTPPESNEEDGNNCGRALSSTLSEVEVDHVSCSEEIDNAPCSLNSAPASLSSANGGNLCSFSDENSVNNGKGDDIQVVKDPKCKYETADGDTGVALAEQNMEGIEEAGKVEVINEKSDNWVLEKSDIPISPHHHQTENSLDAIEIDAAVVTKEKCGVDIVHDVLGFSRDASVVNFKIPILDVNFTPIESSSSEHTLKDLFGDLPELSYEAPCIKGSDDGTPICKQFDLIFVEEDDRREPTPTKGHLSFDMNYCSIMDEPMIADGDNMQDYIPSSNHNTIISSLI